jgi:DNA polymerase bacteriophage-type
MSDRDPGPTFAIDDIAFIDFETRGSQPISVGTDRYSRHAQAIILAWAIGDGPIEVEAVPAFDRPLDWSRMPKPLRVFQRRVQHHEAVYCAHNASFDRAIWNRATTGFPKLEPWSIIDTRVQATVSGLPASLDLAARFAGCDVQKSKDGRELIKLFCLPDSTATPQSHAEAWQRFCDYAHGDIAAMRELFKSTRQLPIAEWGEYWTAEKVNDRGIGIDLKLAESAAKMATVDARRSAAELAQITNGDVTTVNQVARIVDWVMPLLPSEGGDILVKRQEEIDEETGAIVKPEKRSLTRDRILRLLAYLENLEPKPAPLKAAERVLQIRLYGGSKTPAKFSKMLAQQVDGTIRGQYVFNGAAQTGRFSARGIQIHNLMRDAFPHEIDAIDALTAEMPYDDFARLGDDTPVSRKLSLLIRPTLVASPGRCYVWGDWSNIEARIAPWLANDPEADVKLDVFRAVDDGSEPYDNYVRTASALTGLPLDQITEAIRQSGKVTELACVFGGGVGALLAMAASYHIHLTDVEAKAAVERWRNANRWAPRFWGRYDNQGNFGLWGAINKALGRPGQVFEAGRISYVFLRGYLGGSLLCQLPSGRFLTYRRIRWENVEIRDEDTNEVTEVRRELMFSRDAGRVKLWPGLACENVVQATAADILRGTLVRLADLDVRLHTHDEVLVECDEADAQRTAKRLTATMIDGFDWSDGLPIAASAKIGRWYSKSKASWGL